MECRPLMVVDPLLNADLKSFPSFPFGGASVWNTSVPTMLATPSPWLPPLPISTVTAMMNVRRDDPEPADEDETGGGMVCNRFAVVWRLNILEMRPERLDDWSSRTGKLDSIGEGMRMVFVCPLPDPTGESLRVFRVWRRTCGVRLIEILREGASLEFS